MSEEKKEDQKNLVKPKCCKLWKKIIIVAIVLFVIFFIWALILDRPKSSQEEWLSQFSKEDLEQLNLKYNKANIPTRTTPEQTYAQLKEALKNEDIEKAVDCFVEEKREEWKKIFLQVKEEGKMKELTKELSDNFTKNYMYDSIASYSIPQDIDGEIFDHIISFIKDSNGDWKIDSL